MAGNIEQRPHGLRNDVETTWESAVQSYEALREKGKLTDEQWNILTSQTSPSELLEYIATSSYATIQESKLLNLAKSSVDAVVRFDKEISNIASGASSSSFGVPNVAWGGLRFVVHVAEDIFKTPEVILEVIAKIFILMPRIDLYWDLFHDQRDILDFSPLLVSIYKSIIGFNVASISWYASSKSQKLKQSLKGDPRKDFQSLLGDMTDASEEMRKRVEAINLKLQESRQKDLLQKLQQLDLDQQRRIEELREIVTKKRKDDQAELIRCIEEAKVAEANKLRYEREEREEALKPFKKLTEVRESLWRVLRRKPYAVVHEKFIPDLDASLKRQEIDSARNWEKGHYILTYPDDDDLAEISLLIDWRPGDASATPSFRWMINVPDSLYYPGRHFGRLELIRGYSPGTLGSDITTINSRFRVYWESPIFSPFQGDRGLMSSVGPLEDTAAPMILTKVLQSIAHILVIGPFPTMARCPFNWHQMGYIEARYFSRKDASGRHYEDECMRATAFFSNAFNRDLNGLDAFGNIPLPSECRQSSVMAIQELATFYNISDEIIEKMTTENSWKVLESYEDANSQQDWIEKDRMWAARIATLAKFNFIPVSIKDVEATNKILREFETPLRTNSQHVVSSMAEVPLNQEIGSRTHWSTPPLPFPGASRPSCLADDGLPKDWSPLHRAIWYQDLDSVLALANRHTVCVKDNIGYTPLHLACSHSDSLLFSSRQTYDRGLKSRILTSRDERYLCLPYRNNNSGAAFQIAQALINVGADVNATAWPPIRSEDKKLPWTPMHCAANSGWAKVAELLLDNGGSAFSATMCSPICWADADRDAFASDPNIMHKLLKQYLSQEQMDAIHALHVGNGLVKETL